MKRITLALCLSGLLAAPLLVAPVYADPLCQEDAKAMGYLGPIDTLKPCNPQKNAVKEGSDQAAKTPDQQDMAQKQDPGTMEQYGQMQTQ